jgi:Na+/H+-dicarboxylate symporter
VSATARVLAGLAAGAIIGLALAGRDPVAAVRVADIVQPVGHLWLNALQMTVVPLVLALVVIGVNTARDAAASGRIARRAIGVFIVMLTGGALFTALAAPALLALVTPDPALGAALANAAPGKAVASLGWTDWFVGIVPANALMAAAQGAMLPLVVFALFFGFALTRIDPARRTLVLDLFRAIADSMIVIVGWVLLVAPLGVFALILSVCARAGLGMLGALGVYIVLECVLYLSLTVIMVLLAWLWGGERIGRFVAAIVPAQVVAASTQSSLASLPAMLESADRLGCPKPVTALVLPMAVTLFRLTSPVQYVASACFIAWASGIDVPAAQMFPAALLAVAISLGSVGLPGQVSFMATNLPVTQAMGLPVAPLGLLLALDTIPDVFATVGNVTADMAATRIVARRVDGSAS